MIKYKLLALHMLRDCPDHCAIDTACDGNLSTSLAVGSFVGCVRQAISMATARELTVLRVFLHAVFRLPYNDWLPVAVRGTDTQVSITERERERGVFKVTYCIFFTFSTCVVSRQPGRPTQLRANARTHAHSHTH